ncbi:hypothetical protein LRS13_22420 [Svornostia abyssi]|uniref:Uncharacterized protein n=1 Tax=Svornostia abyssi TaxID=2898438 RepID=A0ABY5PFN8_9ACTN|nr:hypothetical protein LRS13_22420 [Parviterribacteraceae bacterium J379]
METGIIYPELGEFVVQDALSELHNHADALEASARDEEDERRGRVVRKQADDLDRRLHVPFG